MYSIYIPGKSRVFDVRERETPKIRFGSFSWDRCHKQALSVYEIKRIDSDYFIEAD